MTNEQINKINITIAEACGWEWKPYGDMMAWYFKGVMKWCREVCGLRKDIKPAIPLPNYCKDLNAMRKEMLTLTNKQGFEFLWHLNDMGFVGGDWELLTLDSQVLAEAFLRTLGKWEE
jgi:hypothetical protein